MKRSILYNNIDSNHLTRSSSIPYRRQNTDDDDNDVNDNGDSNYGSIGKKNSVIGPIEQASTSLTLTTTADGSPPPLTNSNYNNNSNNNNNNTTINHRFPTLSTQQHQPISSPSSAVSNASLEKKDGKVERQYNNSNMNSNVYQNYNPMILYRRFMTNTKLDCKKVISSIVFTFLFLLICDSMFSSPEQRIVQPNFANTFLLWVQDHPTSGMIWILLVMSVAVIFMIPIGTPLTLGCGYIYKGAYGWKLGVIIATIVSMTGSALGAVICFLLGRYMMRDTVKKWIRKYPIFDAIDIAAAEHGFRIMAMLYLTPILPLGPVSYMCGTTSLRLSHFILAKIAALPLMMLYVIIGASTGTLISTNKSSTSDSIQGNDTTNNNNVQNIEDNETLIIAGILLSFASIAGITHYIKKELNHILERQKRELESNDGGKSIVDMTTLSTSDDSSHHHHHLTISTTTDIETSSPSIRASSSSNIDIRVSVGDNKVPITPSSKTSSNLETTTFTAPRQRKH